MGSVEAKMPPDPPATQRLLEGHARAATVPPGSISCRCQELATAGDELARTCPPPSPATHHEADRQTIVMMRSAYPNGAWSARAWGADHAGLDELDAGWGAIPSAPTTTTAHAAISPAVRVPPLTAQL